MKTLERIEWTLTVLWPGMHNNPAVHQMTNSEASASILAYIRSDEWDMIYWRKGTFVFENLWTTLDGGVRPTATFRRIKP